MILHQSHRPNTYLCNWFVSLEWKPTACPCKWHLLNYRQIMNVLTHLLHLRYKNPTSPHCTQVGMPWLLIILFHSTFRGSWCVSGAQILVFCSTTMVSPAKDVRIKSIIHGIIANTSVIWVHIFNLIPKLMLIAMVSYSTLMYIGSDFSSSSWTYVDHHITIAKLFGTDILLNLVLCLFSSLIFFSQHWPRRCITLLLGPTYQLTINTPYLPTYLLTYPPILPIHLFMYPPYLFISQCIHPTPTYLSTYHPLSYLFHICLLSTLIDEVITQNVSIAKTLLIAILVLSKPLIRINY
jgi:hypothetical protein